MKSTRKVTVARNAFELAEVLGLDKEDAIELDFRAKLNRKIIEVVKRERLTHAAVSKRSKASRTRVTAILNGHTKGISTDLLLRILYSLGYKANITFSAAKLAA